MKVKDGRIYLRLIDTEAGYGMVVHTTGRSLTETREIGKLLELKYN